MGGFAWLAIFLLIGEGIVRLFHLPFPGSVIGMGLLLAALHMKWVKLEWVEGSARFLLSHMMLFFAPVIAGILVFYPALLHHWLASFALLAAGTLLVLAASGWTAQRLARRTEEGGRHAD